MIITISGKAGSGKSTIAKMVASKLKYSHHSMGDLQREIAKELNLTIEELAEFEKTDDKYDRMIDDKQIKLGKEDDNFVIDGRLSAHFIPNAFKVFLNVDVDEAIRRRLGHKRVEESFDSPEEVKKSIINREKLNQERWIDFYNYDFLDMNNYNLLIDTTSLSPEEIVDKILKKINN
jgi:predicted cytidylate kinase